MSAIKLSMTSLLMLFALSAHAIDPIEVTADDYKFNPYFARIGATLYVSGPLQNWFGRLWAAMPSPLAEAASRTYTSDPSYKVERVVFVNATSLRPEVTGSEVVIKDRMRNLNITTVVVGRCDLFCSRFFTGGAKRQFGQDMPSQKAHIDIQVPVDYPTQKLELRYPDTQLAIYIRNIPEVESYKSILVEGLTKGGWTGGLHIPADGLVQYCESRNPDINCKIHTGVTALSMGFVTTPERVNVDLPPRFPAPESTGKSVNDMSSLSSYSAGLINGYKRFLDAPVVSRAFAISEPSSPESWYFARGEVDGRPSYVRALKGCESKGSRCRLYAVANDVIW